MTLPALAYLSAHKQLQRQRREHVQSKAEAGDVNEGVVLQGVHGQHHLVGEHGWLTYGAEVV